MRRKIGDLFEKVLMNSRWLFIMMTILTVIAAMIGSWLQTVI